MATSRTALSAPPNVPIPPRGCPALPAAAQPANPTADASAAYDVGTCEFSEGHYAEAAHAFERAATIVPNAVALTTAALAWERAGEPARAADNYARAVSLPGLTDKQEYNALDRLGALEGTLGTLRVRGGSGLFKVRLDGEGIDVPVPAALHAPAGAHVLVVTRAVDSPGASLWSDHRPMVLKTGQIVEVDLEAAGPSHAELPTEAPAGTRSLSTSQMGSTRTRAPLVAGVVLLGTAAAAEIANAIVWWGIAVPAGDQYKSDRASSSRDQATNLEGWVNAIHVGAGALAVAGAACILWQWKGPISRVTVSATSVGFDPSGVSLRGTW